MLNFKCPLIDFERHIALQKTTFFSSVLNFSVTVVYNNFKLLSFRTRGNWRH